MGQRGQGEDSSAIEDIIYKLTGVRCKINGHRVALFFALLLFVFQVVAVQPGYDHWARIKKEVDHPIDCSELSCYEYDDYEVTYGLFVAREKFCADCDSEGSSSQCYWGTSCRRRQLYYTSGDEVDLDDDDLLDDVLSVERRLYGGWYGYDPDCCSSHYSEIDVSEEYGNTLFCGEAAPSLAEWLQESLGTLAVVADSPPPTRRAGVLARLGHQRRARGEVDDLDALQPIYMRGSQFEVAHRRWVG